eukprot:CAMPEP_0170564606 /NCGR_PEP_ID=MMETSP0211-20121228/73866_1 /TAXON_ID=311385 /ORGANISM="Pseudokeronopsis sp., Strain OXSARD2" /LENGTH=59 /DNA_ID=CAMNT_0010884293 /DNA_START=971 /DNA_END=1150 /DNA_ORIENTATION=-
MKQSTTAGGPDGQTSRAPVRSSFMNKIDRLNEKKKEADFIIIQKPDEEMDSDEDELRQY